MKFLLLSLVLLIIFGMMAYFCTVDPVLHRFSVSDYMRRDAPAVNDDVVARVYEICERNGIDWDEFLIYGNAQALFDAREVPAADLRFRKRLVITWYFRLQRDRPRLQAFLESGDLRMCDSFAQELRAEWLAGGSLSPDAAEAIFICRYNYIRGLARLPELRS